VAPLGGGWIRIGGNNSLQSFDFSTVTMLTGSQLNIGSCNNLSQVNLKNGQCVLWTYVEMSLNPSLFCVQVDDPSYCEASIVWEWMEQQGDPSTYSYSTDCGYPVLSIPELPTQPKELLTITDVLGRTTYPTPNTLLFYIYEDGSVEKKMQLER